MIKQKHNEYSKKFFQKILLFIDSAIINTLVSNQEEQAKIFASNLLNIRDAIFSEIIRDNQIAQINTDADESKKNYLRKEKESDLSQDLGLEKDQKVSGS